MRHAVLGAGGVGGFVAAILAHAGHRVSLLLRPESYRRTPPTIRLESPFGNISAPVVPALTLESAVDVLWITTKATQLEPALATVPEPGKAGAVVPLLNGVDHVARLRSVFGENTVIPATISGELERVDPGHFVQRSPFARFRFATAGQAVLADAVKALTRFGCSCEFESDELTMLWRKLVMLAPMALNTTAAMRTVGELWAEPDRAGRFEASAREACAVAKAAGARVDADETVEIIRSMPAGLRSSMQKDVAAGRPPEIDAIAGPILRGGLRYGIPVPVTAALAREISG